MLRRVAAVLQGEGTELPGYERFDKTQFQVNALKTFSNILGASVAAAGRRDRRAVERRSRL